MSHVVLAPLIIKINFLHSGRSGGKVYYYRILANAEGMYYVQVQLRMVLSPVFMRNFFVALTYKSFCAGFGNTGLFTETTGPFFTDAVGRM